MPQPRWVVVSTFLLSLAGLGVSIYMTVAHYAGAQVLACPVSHVINCEAVTTSPQSYFLGVPVVLLGLTNFVAMVGLTSPWAWRSSTKWVEQFRITLVAVATAFVLWLVYAELMIIKHICIWCTSIHVITFALLAVIGLSMNRVKDSGQQEQSSGSSQ